MSAARTALQRDSDAPGHEPTAHPGERIRRLVGKTGSDTMQPSLHPEVFFNFLHGTQEGQQVAPNPQSSTTEQVHHPKEIQNGNSCRDPQTSVCGPVGHVLGPQGRLPSHPGTAQRPGVPLFLLQGPALPFCGNAFRTFNGPENLHARVEGLGGLPPPKRNSGLYVPGRLAHRSGVQGALPTRHSFSDSRDPVLGLGHKSAEIQSRAHPATSLPRGTPRSTSGRRLPHRGETERHYRRGPPDVGLTGCPGSGMVSPLGLHGQHGGPGTLLSSSYETTSVASSSLLQASISPVRHPCAGNSSDNPPPTVVVPVAESFSGGPFPTTSTRGDVDNGRLSPGMGSLHRGSIGVRPMAPPLGYFPHKSSGVRGGDPRSVSVSTPRQGTEGPGSIGQHHSGGLHQSPGRNSLLQPMETVLGSLPVDVTVCNHLGSNSLTRDSQHQSGCSLPSVAAVLRVDAESSHLFSSAGQMPDLPRGGPVRLPGEQPDTSILQPVSPPEGLARERPVLPLEGTRFLCLPSTSISGESTTQDRVGRDSISPTRRPVLASQSLVPQASQVVGGPALQAATTSGPTFSSRPGLTAPRPFGPSLGCLAPIRESFIKEGFSEEAALMAAQGRRPSTLNLYNRRLRLFGEWCSDRSIGPSEASLGQIADFLLYIFHLGRKVNTVRGYRSAIAAVHSGFPDGGSISTSVPLNQLIKGMFLERPTVRTLVPPWSLSSVLETLAGAPFEPLHLCSLKLLTLKTVFLVSLASGRRRGAIRALSTAPGHLLFLPHGVRLVPQPSFLAKNQTIDFLPHPIFIPKISTFSSVLEDKVWCPVRALLWYFDKTKGFRAASGEKALFITHQAPHRQASLSTISRWIVETISFNPSSLTGPGTPHAHDVRGVAASWALFQGVPLEDILQSAVWKNPNSFISCYLTDVLRDEGRFGRAALASVSVTTR